MGLTLFAILKSLIVTYKLLVTVFSPFYVRSCDEVFWVALIVLVNISYRPDPKINFITIFVIVCKANFVRCSLNVNFALESWVCGQKLLLHLYWCFVCCGSLSVKNMIVEQANKQTMIQLNCLLKINFNVKFMIFQKRNKLYICFAIKYSKIS